MLTVHFPDCPVVRVAYLLCYHFCASTAGLGFALWFWLLRCLYMSIHLLFPVKQLPQLMTMAISYSPSLNTQLLSMHLSHSLLCPASLQ